MTEELKGGGGTASGISSEPEKVEDLKHSASTVQCRVNMSTLHS